MTYSTNPQIRHKSEEVGDGKHTLGHHNTVKSDSPHTYPRLFFKLLAITACPDLLATSPAHPCPHPHSLSFPLGFGHTRKGTTTTTTFNQTTAAAAPLPVSPPKPSKLAANPRPIPKPKPLCARARTEHPLWPDRPAPHPSRHVRSVVGATAGWTVGGRASKAMT